MSKYITLLLLLACASCGKEIPLASPRPYPAAPIIPDLSKELEEACPPLKPLPDGSVKALVEAAATDPIFYAECKRHFQEAILQYKRVKKEQDSHRAQVELYHKK